MTKDNFIKLLNHSSKYSWDFAKRYVIDDLPNQFLYEVKLNQSSDDPNLIQFKIYPNDNGKTYSLVDAKKVADILVRENKVPVWIDISVKHIYKKYTIFELKCSGRYSNNKDEYYYLRNKTGPFGIKGPTFPLGYKNGDKFPLRPFEISFINRLKLFLK